MSARDRKVPDENHGGEKVDLDQLTITDHRQQETVRLSIEEKNKRVKFVSGKCERPIRGNSPQGIETKTRKEWRSGSRHGSTVRNHSVYIEASVVGSRIVS